MPLQIYPVLIYRDNYAYVLVCSESGETAVIDAGADQPILDFLQSKKIALSKILSTHHHGDHTAGNHDLKAKTHCRIIGSSKDRIAAADEKAREGDIIEIGAQQGHVIETPGHTRGHICFYFPESKAVFTGDTLFSAGCGRLFEGSATEMHRSLQKLAALPENTQLYCGHEYTQSNIKFALTIEPNNLDLIDYRNRVAKLRQNDNPTTPSSIVLEKKINPFLRLNSPEIRKNLNLSDAPDAKVFAEIRSRKDCF